MNVAVTTPAEERVRLLGSLRAQIASGIFAPQAAFPSERRIAEQYAAGRSAVRWAVGVLEREGWIRQVGPRTRVVQAESTQSAGVAWYSKIAGDPSRDSAERGLLSDTVAVLAGEDAGEHSRPGVSAPGWSFYVAHGAMHALHADGLHVIRVNRTALTPDEIRRFAAGGIRAVIVPEYTTLDRGMLDALAAAGVPTVVAGDRPEAEGLDRVVSDHAAGTASEVRWLIAQGRRRIVQLLSDEWESFYWLRDRRRGYEAALRECGLEPLPPLLLHPEAHVPGTARDRGEIERQARFLAGYLVQAKAELQPDALLLFSDENIAAAALACRYCGLEPGRDVALAGYDDFWREHWTQQVAPFPPQVTVDKQNWEIGCELARLALARAAGTLPSEPQVRLVSPRLVPPDALAPTAPPSLVATAERSRSKSLPAIGFPLPAPRQPVAAVPG